MNLKDKKVFLTRPYKVVYKDGDRIIKVFIKDRKSTRLNSSHLA